VAERAGAKLELVGFYGVGLLKASRVTSLGYKNIMSCKTKEDLCDACYIVHQCVGVKQ